MKFSGKQNGIRAEPGGWSVEVHDQEQRPLTTHIVFGHFSEQGRKGRFFFSKLPEIKKKKNLFIFRMLSNTNRIFKISPLLFNWHHFSSRHINLLSNLYYDLKIVISKFLRKRLKLKTCRTNGFGISTSSWISKSVFSPLWSIQSGTWAARTMLLEEWAIWTCERLTYVSINLI